MRNKSYLSTEGLTVGYNGVPLISDIALDLKKGEILTLIGPNGSGKSTILKSITRHLPTLSGVVWLDGADMKTMSGKETAEKLAVVLTDRIRPDLMTCGEVVATGRYPYTGSFGVLKPHDREIVAQALAKVNASDLADRDFSAISDGQRQRILLARAICQEPEIIVLDEPTSYLDIRHKIELLEILNEMAKERDIAVIMSLHEIDLAYKVSDKIVCVKGEKIAAYGTPDEVFGKEDINRLYDIRRGVFNAMLGSVELSRPQGKPQCFVIGGGGTGIPFYRALQKTGVPFAAGILFENDVDCVVAASLAEKLITARAFVPIGESEIAQARGALEEVEYVIDCGCPCGVFNQPNEELKAYAARLGKPVVTSLRELAEVAL